jgi:hypothetical protein
MKPHAFVAMPFGMKKDGHGNEIAEPCNPPYRFRYSTVSYRLRFSISFQPITPQFYGLFAAVEETIVKKIRRKST